MPETEPESRVGELNRHKLTDIIYATREGLALLRPFQDDIEALKEIEALKLPTQLTRQEIDDIGLQVNTLAELMVPSRDAIKNGMAVERRVVFGLGAYAVVEEDTITALNAAHHLKKNVVGFRGKFMGWSLDRQLRDSVQ